MMERLVKISFCIFILLSIAGCSVLDNLTGQPESLRERDWTKIEGDVSSATSAPELTTYVSGAYIQVAEVCISVANYYERRAKYGDATRLTIGVVGTLAAGVVAPALAAANAARSIIAIWAGVGGVSAGFLTSYDQTQFATKANIDAYNQIRSSLRNFDLTPQENIKTVDDAKKVLVQLKELYTECKLPPLSAEETTQQQVEDAKSAASAAQAAQKAAEEAYASAASESSAAAAAASSAVTATNAVNAAKTKR